MGESMTALISAFARAHHSQQRGQKIFDDVPARALLGQDYDTVAGHMRQMAAFFNPNLPAEEREAVEWVMCRKLAGSPLGRAAFAENALKTETTLGTRQYVLLGAGYDTFVYRRPDWAQQLTVFLLDRPEMLKDRRERAEWAELTAQGAVAEIGADFSQSGWIDQLIGHPLFSSEQRTFVAMLGLSYYVDREALERILSALGTALPEGSALAFDYMDAGGSENMRMQGMLARAAGEPMHQGYDFDGLEELLGRHGFLIYEHLTPEEIEERFFRVYNRTHPDNPVCVVPGVNYCLAVRK